MLMLVGTGAVRSAHYPSRSHGLLEGEGAEAAPKGGFNISDISNGAAFKAPISQLCRGDVRSAARLERLNL